MRSASPFTTLAAGLRTLMSLAFVCALLFGALIAFEFAIREELDVLVGVPRVVDGDTLVIDGVNIRLAGLDAPERAQECEDAGGATYACGRAATDYLRFLIDERETTCRGHGLDRYGRMIGACRANGVDLSEAMIRRGWAVAYLGDLDAIEGVARERGIGMWAGSFERPNAWRRQRRSADIDLSLAAIRDAARVAALRLRGLEIGLAPGDE